MDEFNVIVPTNNLDELEKDMDSWVRLPHKLRILSNDACMRKYNCTVNDLYHNLKEKILKAKDQEKVEPDNVNIVKEDGEFDDLDWQNYHHILALSKQIQMNPLIVIIDPDISTIEDLNTRFESFNLLKQKFKIYSNDYSMQLWGYNVPEMYERVKNVILNAQDKNNADSNNVKIVECAKVSKSRSIVNALIDNITHRIANCNENAIENIDFDIPEDDYISFAMYKRGIKMVKTLEVSIPQFVPWFTPEEIDKFSPNFSETDPTSLYKKIKEAMNVGDKSKVRELGWNPSIKLGEDTTMFARNRQKNWFANNAAKVYDIREEADIQPVNKTPLYLIFTAPIPDTNNIQQYNIEDYKSPFYDKIAIAFDNDLKDVWQLNKDDDGAIQFFKTDLANVVLGSRFEVVVICLDNDIYNQIKNNINRIVNSNGASALYMYIKNGNTDLDRANEKLVYAYTLEILRKYTDNNAEIDNRYYRVFKGLLKDMNLDRIKEISQLLQGN